MVDSFGHHTSISTKATINGLLFAGISLYQIYNAIMNTVFGIMANYGAARVEIVKIVALSYVLPLVSLFFAAYHLVVITKGKQSIFFDIELIMNTFTLGAILYGIIYLKDVTFIWKIGLIVSMVLFLLGNFMPKKDENSQVSIINQNQTMSRLVK